MSQGRELTYEQKQAVLQVKKYMDKEKSLGKFASALNPSLRTAQALNFSLSTVKNILSAADKNEGIVEKTERKARGAWCTQGGRP